MTNVEGLGRELTLRETQLASLEILKSIDCICRERGLRYWLAYGTLLGAVRHKGFIPWDDDLDIYMPRPDYEALLGHFAGHDAELRPLVAINSDTVERCPFLITRISDTRYKMVGECGLDVEEMGAFVDIYPIDGLGDDEAEARRIKARCEILTGRYVQSGNFKAWNRDVSSLKACAKRFRSHLMPSPDSFLKEERALLGQFNYDESDFISVCAWSSTVSLIYRKVLFDNSLDCQFEDLTISIPVGYDEILSGTYGDYMTPPPEQERVGHHFYSLHFRG